LKKRDRLLCLCVEIENHSLVKTKDPRQILNLSLGLFFWNQKMIINQLIRNNHLIKIIFNIFLKPVQFLTDYHHMYAANSQSQKYYIKVLNYEGEEG